MTDKEKAEEYVKTNHSHIMSGTMKSIYKKSILTDLQKEEKRQSKKNFKEAYQKYVNNSLATFDMKKALEDARDQIRIAKENEKLKEQIEQLEKENKELKKQTEKIIEIDTTKIFELTAELNELKAQVAKQRCKNVFATSDDSSQAVPCYIFYSCNNCPRRS